jgi:hypothetical protein
MDEFLEKLTILVVGWLLGLLGPAIVDAIRRTRENKLGRKAILSELHEVGGVLAVAVFAVKSKQGTVDRAHLEWLKTYLERGKRTTAYTDWIGRLETQLSWSDEEIARNFTTMKVDDGKGTLLQRYPVPLLDSRVSALWSFDTSFQRRLLEIRQIMHRLDGLVDRTYKLHDMSFSNLDATNRALLSENVKGTAAFYAESAKHVVDKIAELTP